MGLVLFECLSKDAGKASASATFPKTRRAFVGNGCCSGPSLRGGEYADPGAVETMMSAGRSIVDVIWARGQQGCQCQRARTVMLVRMLCSRSMYRSQRKIWNLEYPICGGCVGNHPEKPQQENVYLYVSILFYYYTYIYIYILYLWFWLYIIRIVSIYVCLFLAHNKTNTDQLTLSQANSKHMTLHTTYLPFTTRTHRQRQVES